MIKMNSFGPKARIIGLIIGLFACFFCWGERSVTETSYCLFYIIPQNKTFFIRGLPTFGSTLFAVLAMIIMYKRNIINVSVKNNILTIATLIIDVTVISTLLSLFMLDVDTHFLKRIGESITLIVATTFLVAMLLFGMRGMARLTFILYIIFYFAGTVSVISTALGFLGYLAIIGFSFCFYTQDMICFDSIGNELLSLYGKTTSVVHSAGYEIENLGSKYIQTSDKEQIESINQSTTQSNIQHK